MYKTLKKAPSLTRLLSLVLAAVAVQSCDDIFEKDISGEQVELVSPGDNVKTDIPSVEFMWNSVEKALEYQFQIAYPTFDAAQLILLDSVFDRTSFTVSLAPGQYEWRVRAKNGSSETAYSTRSLEIDSLLNFNLIQLTLTNPSDSLITKDSTLIFRWRGLTNTSSYNLTVNRVSDAAIVADKEISPDLTEQQLSFADGKYEWEVTARNAETNTETQPFQPKPWFWIDTETPEVPELLNPDVQEVTADTLIDFNWGNYDSDLGSDIEFEFLLSPDSQFISNKWDTLIAQYDLRLILERGVTYFWKVKAQDEAGNKSDYSERRKVIITQ